MLNTPAPIVLFAYNRPTHTRKTVEALRKNDLAGDSDLIIFADGPRLDADRPAVREVRAYLRTITGFNSVRITERERNIGLAHSVISGVTEIANRYGKVIVLEDDIVTARFFLKYMNDALNRYELESRVMHISGYMFPLKQIDGLPETFFYRGTSCWGWGTWKRAWDSFEPDAPKLMKEIDRRNARYQFNVLGSLDYHGMLKAHADGKLDSWAVRWYASVFLKNGLCLHPSRSLARNIGHDRTGTHCGKTENYDVEVSNRAVNAFNDVIEEDPGMLLKIIEYNNSIRPSLVRRALSAALHGLLGGKIS